MKNEIKEMLELHIKNEIDLLPKNQKKVLDYIINLQEIRKEHSIMKQFIYENGLWEKLLNDDRFLEHLRSDDSE